MRVRELAVEYSERGEHFEVWAWKRDRFGEAPYPDILALELEPYGVALRSLDDSGEGDGAQLLNSLKDSIARKERKDLVRRTRMGKYAKARTGKVLAGGKPTYGYHFSEDRNSLVEHPEELAVLRRMFEWARDGSGPMAYSARRGRDPHAVGEGGVAAPVHQVDPPQRPLPLLLQRRDPRRPRTRSGFAVRGGQEVA